MTPGIQAVNDSHGYQSGDSLIQEAARRLRAAVGERGMVTRLGGNQFAVLVANVSDAAELEALSHTIQSAMQPAVVIGWSHLPLSLRIGAALFPQDAAELDPLLELAGMRMQGG